MFDVNLLKNPGLQSDNNPIKLKKDLIVKKKNKNDNIKNNQNIKLNWYYLVVIAVLLFLVYAFFLINKNMNNEDYLYRKFNVYDFCNIISDNIEVIRINNMTISDKYLSADLIIDGNKDFYNLMDKFSYLLGESVKGSKFNNNYFMKFKVYKDVKKQSNLNIDELKKEMEDFGLDISSEIYNNKLILVSDSENLINLIDFLNKIRILDKFEFNIKSIDDFELYKILIYN